jgi:DNA-binding transcriptional regulator YhcF (GntR family)
VREEDVSEPPYRRIVAEIRRRIDAGQLSPGDRVPSTRQITQDWGVAMATATKVLTALRQEGLVRVVPGVGTIVDSPRAARPRLAETDLSRERIVRTAIAIADVDRLPALSMRRVAAELGVAPMSLYRHVPGKDELVLLMADEVIGETAFPANPPAGWRARLDLLARLQWSLYRRHPWLAQVLSVTRPQVVPNLLSHAEWALNSVDGLGLTPATMLYVHITVFGFVRGVAINLEWEAEAEQYTGMDGEQWLEVQLPAMLEIMASGDIPTFTRVVTAGAFDLDLDLLFEFGLRRLLDGFGVLFAARDRKRG